MENLDNKKVMEEEGKAFQEKAIWNSPLDQEEQLYEDHSEEFVPMKNQEELRKELISAARRNIDGRKSKKTVTINLDWYAIGYFKDLAEETGVSYQNLINLYLVQCAKEKKKLYFK